MTTGKTAIERELAENCEASLTAVCRPAPGDLKPILCAAGGNPGQPPVVLAAAQVPRVADRFSGGPPAPREPA